MKKIILFLAVFIIIACGSIAAISAPSQAFANTDRREELLGIWAGTFRYRDNVRGLKMFIYRYGENYQAAAFYFSDPLTKTDLISHYLGEVHFDAAANIFEVVYTHVHFTPPGWTRNATFRATLSGNVFSGDFIAGGAGTGYLTRAESSDIMLAEPHDHIAGDVYRVIAVADCQNEGLVIFECIFCSAEAGRESIPMLAHTPSGNRIVYLEPTCAAPGRNVQHCIACGEIALEEPIPARRHTFTRQRISGNIFIPPIVYSDICVDCGYEIELAPSFAMAWLLPVIAFVPILAIVIILLVKRKTKRREFVCPYCYIKHPVYNVQFRCTNISCPDVDDIELSLYEGLNIDPNNPNASPPLKRKLTFPAPHKKKIPKFAQCPRCGKGTSKTVCPSCHNSLPESVLTGEDRII